jgi:hypothetical protein
MRWSEEMEKQKLKGQFLTLGSSFSSPVGDALTLLKLGVVIFPYIRKK